jgi:GNAT superfamily N-acetyltransferase
VTAFVIREATDEDAGELARLVIGLGYDASPEAMRHRLEKVRNAGHAATFVVELGGAAVGFVGLRLERSYEYDDPHVRITGLAVDHDQRGRGIGTALLERAEAWAREHGAALIFLTSGQHRSEAHEFYESRGWKRTGYRFAKRLEGDGD